MDLTDKVFMMLDSITDVEEKIKKLRNEIDIPGATNYNMPASEYHALLQPNSILLDKFERDLRELLKCVNSVRTEVYKFNS